MKNSALTDGGHEGFEQWLEEWLLARFGPDNKVNRKVYRDFTDALMEWLFEENK